MTNPLLVAAVRRHWPVLGAVIVLVALSLSDQLLLRPTGKRYETALKRASELGIALDPDNLPAVLPPRLFALLGDNSLPEVEAAERGNSGALTAELLEGLADLTGRHGIQVVVTEPGPVTQQPQAVVVRARLKLRCGYGDFVDLLESMAKDRKLVAVERFTLAVEHSGATSVDVWVSRYFLKRS